MSFINGSPLLSMVFINYLVIYVENVDNSKLLLLIRLFSCFVNVTIITKPPGFVIVITILKKKFK